MSSVRRLDIEKLRVRRIIATAMLTAVTVAFLLLKDASAEGSATLLATERSHHAADDVPSSLAEAQTASSARSVRPQEE
jgi:hypothetical protein